MVSIPALFQPVDYLKDFLQGGENSLADIDGITELVSIGQFSALPLSWKDLMNIVDTRIIWFDSETFLTSRESGRSWTPFLHEPLRCYYELELTTPKEPSVDHRGIAIYSCARPSGRIQSHSALQSIFPILEKSGAIPTTISLLGNEASTFPFSLNSIPRFAGIKKLDLSYITLTVSGSLVLSHMRLEELSLRSVIHEDGGLQFVSMIEKGSSSYSFLSTLRLWDDIGMRFDCFQNFCHAIGNSLHLRNLTLMWTRASGFPIDPLFSAIEKSQVLEELCVFVQNWSPPQFESFCNAISQHRSLKYLNLNDRNQFRVRDSSDQVIRSHTLLEALRLNKSLQYIDVSGADHDSLSVEKIMAVACVNRCHHFLCSIHSSTTQESLLVLSCLLPYVSTLERYAMLRSSSGLLFSG